MIEDCAESVIVVKNQQKVQQSKYWYLDVSLLRADEVVTVTYFKMQVLNAMKQMFGEFGAASPIDIMKFSPLSARAILRCPASSYVKLRGSLTLTSTCVFKIHKTSPILISLLSNSRSYDHTA